MLMTLLRWVSSLRVIGPLNRARGGPSGVRLCQQQLGDRHTQKYWEKQCCCFFIFSYLQKPGCSALQKTFPGELQLRARIKCSCIFREPRHLQSDQLWFYSVVSDQTSWLPPCLSLCGIVRDYSICSSGEQ